MTSVVSYLSPIDPDGGAIEPLSFDYRIHENVDTSTHQSISEHVLRDRKSVPAHCTVNWHI